MHTISDGSELSTIRLAGELIKDPERKSLLKIFFEVCYLLVLYREIPAHYFSRYLFKEGTKNIADYLPGTFLYKVKTRFNKSDARHMLDNKLFFDFYYRKIDFSLPEIWMHNNCRIFILEGKIIKVNNLDDFKSVVERIIKAHSLDNTVFLKKSYDSYGGANIYKIHIDQFNSMPEEINEIYSEVIKTSFIFQKTIKQHHEMDRLNPFCLNTMRLDTFINPDCSIEIISGYLKTNIRNHYVDNAPAGSCEISVDLETGKLFKHGHLTLKFNGLSRPTQHPTTMAVFENFTVPYFKEAKELAVQAARVMPDLRLVGWDIAIGEHGPVLIEGNSDYDIAANDLAYGGYRTNPVFQKILREVNDLK
jgi:hypothetical protein